MKISASQLAFTPKKDYHPIENDFATWVKSGLFPKIKQIKPLVLSKLNKL